MKRISALLPFFAVLCSVVALGLSASAAQAGIKKCKDANGRWHYGDHAATECARSKVIEFKAGQAGQKVIDAPPTQEELDAEKATEISQEKEKERQAEQAAQDKLLAQSYAVEDDIIYERNRKLKDLQASIDSGNATLEHLKGVLTRAEKRAAEEKATKAGVSKTTTQTLERAKHQVERHSEVIAEKQKELEETKTYYEDALKRYREMKRRKSATGTR